MLLNNENQIRILLTKFLAEHEDFNYEKGQSQVFWSDFFQCFGIPANVYGLWFENSIDRKFIDAFYPKHFIIEQKSEGRNLDEAYSQAIDYANRLIPDKIPLFIIVSDFKQFRIKNLQTSEVFEFNYDELNNYIPLWKQILGEKKAFVEEITVNIEAGDIMADLHDALKASGYIGKDLEMLLVRLLFCLFADDTGIFDKDIFQDEVTQTPAKLLGGHLSQIFSLLNSDVRSSALDEGLAKFPYVNGGLFEKTIAQVSFDNEMKGLLDKACSFNWAKISPIIFGSIFQHAMDEKERRNFGAHFTTIENIKKVLDPLFIKDLNSEFAIILEKHRGVNRTRELQKLMQKIGKLVIFDPACGCGNFLSVAYTELRILENKILMHAYKQGNFDNIATLIHVKISNFYGVEIDEFSSYVARVSMWLTEQQMFMDLAKRFGTYQAKLPLDDEANIICGNSLSLDWNRDALRDITPNYIIGNPPFVGKQFQTKEQKEDIMAIFPSNPKAKSLDYVCCWYKKASNFIKTSQDTEVAFVSTNSICQGEQTAILWKDLFSDGVKINFAHQTFKWTTEIKGGAAVYVIVVGFAIKDRKDKRLFVYDNPTKVDEYNEIPVSTINAYLVEGVNVFIDSRSTPLCDVEPMIFGTMPIDNGNFLFTKEEKDEFLNKEPLAKKWFRDTIGAREFINKIPRYSLWLEGIDPKELNTLPLVKARVEKIRQFRLASADKGTREKLSQYPTQFRDDHTSHNKAIMIPRVSSENRDYIPIDFAKENMVVLDSMLVIHSESTWLFAILTSRMHMAWMRTVCGRLESRYRYSKDIVYNNFPFLNLDDDIKDQLIELADDILLARQGYPTSSLAYLYNPTTMPPNLRKAHTKLDNYVDKLYNKKSFKSDSERVAMLLLRYQELVDDGLFKTPTEKIKKKGVKSEVTSDVMKISNSQIDKISQKLKQDSENKEANTELDKYRSNHIKPMTEVVLKLQEWLSNADIAHHSAQRLKRKPQILFKLSRFSIRLSQLQDIAGCRIIFDNNQAIDSFIEIMDIQMSRKKVKFFTIVRKVDYRKDGREDSGYRAVHIIVKRHDIHIEIQLRTKSQHNWAETAERTSAMYGYSLKNGEGDETVRKFFKLFSSLSTKEENGINISEQEKKNFDEQKEKIIEIIKNSDKHNIIHNETAKVFLDSLESKGIENTSKVSNYLFIFNRTTGEFKQWMNVTEKTKDPQEIIDIYVRYEAEFPAETHEVVLIGISKIADVKTTHSHYFGNSKFLEDRFSIFK